MGLSLTSAAALHLGRAARGAACLGRGLDGQELVLCGQDAVAELADEGSPYGAHVIALRVESLDASSAPPVAELAGRWNVPVSVPWQAAQSMELRWLAELFEKAGARLFLAHGTNLEEVLGLIAAIEAASVSNVIGLAWEVRPSTESLDDAGAVLLAARDYLGLVRLHGGGPEQHDQDGRGLDALLVDLALSRYTGPIALCPSAPKELPRWHAWLASRKATGCGGAINAKLLRVDVRSVEPKDRLETILGSYAALAKGGTLELTVDHDPSCMYFMLEATEPAGSFHFEITDNGPEVWRARVKKND